MPSALVEGTPLATAVAGEVKQGDKDGGAVDTAKSPGFARASGALGRWRASSTAPELTSIPRTTSGATSGRAIGTVKTADAE